MRKKSAPRKRNPSPPPQPVSRRIGYARVSTLDQSLDLQTDALTKAGCLPDDIYKDKSTGAHMNRMGLQSAFKALRAGDTLVIWKLDRLGRNVGDLLAVLEMMKERDIGLISLQDSIDTSTAMGRFLFHLLASLAQLERELTVERTHAGLRSARARGRVGGAPRAFSPEAEKKIAAQFYRRPADMTYDGWVDLLAAEWSEVAGRKISTGTIRNIAKRHPPQKRKPKRKAKR